MNRFFRFFRFLPALGLGSILALAAGGALAHAIVTWSSLKENPPVANTSATVTVRFNAGIESKFARVSLFDAKGENTPIERNLAIGQNEIGIPLPPLAPGTYALRIKVLAADGHYTEENLRFKVAPGK